MNASVCLSLSRPTTHAAARSPSMTRVSLTSGLKVSIWQFDDAFLPSRIDYTMLA
jgi:hypothetical protein